MSEKIGKLAVQRVLELSPEERDVTFHGSEPLINFNLIKKLISYSDGSINWSMQSNGTLFNDETISFLKENNVGVGISLDGLKRHHNKTRPYANGNSSYETIWSNIDKLINQLGGVSVITVVSKYNVDDLEEITKTFEEKGIYSVRYSPLFPNPKNKKDCPNTKKLTANIKKLIENYISNIENSPEKIKIMNTTDLLRNFFNEKTTYNCAKCSGTNYNPLLTIDTNGDIYPCDFFWGSEKFKIGNIDSMSIKEASNHSRNFRKYRDISLEEKCQPCNWARFCGNGCPGAQLIENGKLTGEYHYCEHTIEMLKYMAKKIPEIYEKGLLEKILLNE